MVTNTTNYGWTKAEGTEPANVTTYNLTLDSIDSAIHQKELIVAPVEPVLGKYKFTGDAYFTRSSYAPARLLNTTTGSSYTWEDEFRIEGVNGGDFDFSSEGFLTFNSEGIYRYSYNFTHAGMYMTEGLVRFGLYRFFDYALVPRTEQQDRMFTYDEGGYASIVHTGYIEVSATGDAQVYDTTSSTMYCWGAYSDSNLSPISLSTNFVDAWPYVTTFTLEYVRSL